MKYEITEEQIKELAKGNAKVKKMFPEAFELKLEIGKWYKDIKNGLLLNFQGEYSRDGDSRSYGLSAKKTWSENLGVKNDGLGEYILATDLEVLEALTNEAKKRGFKEGVYIKSFCSDSYKLINNKLSIGKEFYNCSRGEY